MPRSSALQYRYLTSFKIILLSEFYFLTSNTNESVGQSRPALPTQLVRDGANSSHSAKIVVPFGSGQFCTDFGEPAGLHSLQCKAHQLSNPIAKFAARTPAKLAFLTLGRHAIRAFFGRFEER
jgi:hypothetical protein